MSVHEENEKITESTMTELFKEESSVENMQETKAFETVPVPVQVTEQNPELIEKEKDPCKEKEPPPVQKETRKISTVGLDPRFQQQNQTLRCFVMYTDFYRCENILGEGAEACAWFKKAFNTICPSDWVQQWDQRRIEGRLPWSKYKTQGQFPGNKYGD